MQNSPYQKNKQQLKNNKKIIKITSLVSFDGNNFVFGFT